MLAHPTFSRILVFFFSPLVEHLKLKITITFNLADRSENFVALRQKLVRFCPRKMSSRSPGDILFATRLAESCQLAKAKK